MSVVFILDFSAFPGNLNVFHDDGVFWVTFSCIALLVPVIFLGCLRIVSVPGQSDGPARQPSGVPSFTREDSVVIGAEEVLQLSSVCPLGDSGQVYFPHR